MRTVVTTKEASSSASRSPYSDGIKANGFLFVSGQGPLDETGRARTDLSLEEQIRLTMKNVVKVLTAGGSSLGQVVQCGVYLGDSGNCDRMNAVYTWYFPEAPPVRTTIESRLSDGIAVEIDCVAL